MADAKGRLTRFYEKYNPAKLANVDSTLQQYAGQEEELFKALVGKYGAEPAAASPSVAAAVAAPAAAAAPASTNYKARLTAFYEKYNPSKVANVDSTLQQYAG